MRPSILAIAAAAVLLAAPAARAAPTCQDRNGETMRCGTPGAMPVGWTPPPRDRQSGPAPPTAEVLLGLIYGVGGLFALIALMPPFDGWSPGDWDRQEGDEG
jgi:hypothetical protein